MLLSSPLTAPAPAPCSPPCSSPACCLQKLVDKVKQQYRVRLILDNLPITTYDLELDPESGACVRRPVAAGSLPGQGGVEGGGQGLRLWQLHLQRQDCCGCNGRRHTVIVRGARGDRCALVPDCHCCCADDPPHACLP